MLYISKVEDAYIKHGRTLLLVSYRFPSINQLPIHRTMETCRTNHDGLMAANHESLFELAEFYHDGCEALRALARLKDGWTVPAPLKSARNALTHRFLPPILMFPRKAVVRRHSVTLKSWLEPDLLVVMFVVPQQSRK